MSYRALKLVLGEANLERKCFFLFGLFLVTGIVGSFWWYSHQTDDLVLDATRHTAHGLAETMLYRQHWDILDTQEKSWDEELSRKLGDALGQSTIPPKFIHPGADTLSGKFDDFELGSIDFFNRNPP